MFDLLVNAEGGLTTAGYVVCAIAGIALFVLAILFAGRNSEKKKMGTRQLVFCAMAIALAYVTSYLKLFSLPWGGSDSVQYAFYRADRKLVRRSDWDLCRSGIWDYAVFAGALCTFIFPGML